jgi:hypothetical protein
MVTTHDPGLVTVAVVNIVDVDVIGVQSILVSNGFAPRRKPFEASQL